MKIFNQTFDSIEKALNYSTERNSVISNNIANVDTPNYKTRDVTFKNILNQEENHLSAKRTHPKHLPFSTVSSGYQTVINRNTMYSHNGNNVDIDKEMTSLAENQIYYRSMVDRLNGKFNTLQTVIRGGR